MYTSSNRYGGLCGLNMNFINVGDGLVSFVNLTSLSRVIRNYGCDLQDPIRLSLLG
jgi:hypothetical protein